MADEKTSAIFINFKNYEKQIDSELEFWTREIIFLSCFLIENAMID